MTQQPEDFVVVDDHLDPAERDIEAPPEDAVEQATPANPAERPEEPRVPFDVDEADALDQAAVVELDDGYEY